MTRAAGDGYRGGFTFIEVIVALSLFALVAVILLQAFTIGIAHAGRSNERAAATTLAIQILEQIRASANPVTFVNIAPLPRTPLPLTAPYDGVTNPTPHTFEAAVVLTTDDNLGLVTATVQIFRPDDVDPYVEMTTLLDDQ